MVQELLAECLQHYSSSVTSNAPMKPTPLPTVQRAPRSWAFPPYMIHSHSAPQPCPDLHYHVHLLRPNTFTLHTNRACAALKTYDASIPTSGLGASRKDRISGYPKLRESRQPHHICQSNAAERPHEPTPSQQLDFILGESASFFETGGPTW